MATPAQQPEKKPKAYTETEALLKQFEKEDEDKELSEALAALDKSLDEVRERQLLDAEFEENFEGIKDKPAIEAEQHVEEAFKHLESGQETPAPAAEKRKYNVSHNIVDAAAAQLKGELADFRKSQKIDVVLDAYKPDMAQAELLEKPMYAALEASGIHSADDTDKLAGDLISQNNPAYASMDAEAQAAARKMIMPMVENTLKHFRDAWRKGVVESIQMKLGMLEHNQEMLEEARAALSDPKALKAHDESIEKNRRMMENARSLISSFSE